MKRIHTQLILLLTLIANSLSLHGMFTQVVKRTRYNTTQPVLRSPLTPSARQNSVRHTSNKSSAYYSDTFIDQERESFYSLKKNVEDFLMQDYIREALIHELNTTRIPFNEKNIERANRYKKTINEIRLIMERDHSIGRYYYDQLQRNLSHEPNRELEILTQRYEPLLSMIKNIQRNAESYLIKHEKYQSDKSSISE